MYTSAALVVYLISLAPVSLASPAVGRDASLPTSENGPLMHPRQGSGVEALSGDISTIAKNLAAANESVAGFQAGGLKGIMGLSKINSAVLDLGDALTSTTKTAASTSPPLNVADSTTVGVQFLNVQPNINILLNNLMTKRKDLDGAAFGLLDTRSLIRDSLAGQQTGAKDLGSSLIDALDPSLAATAQPINDQIQGNFTSTVDSFKGRSGVIKIPTKLVPAVSQLLDKLSSALPLKRQDGEDFESIIGTRASSGYCCGITQAQIDSLGANENDYSQVPLPVRAVLKSFGMEDAAPGLFKAVDIPSNSSGASIATPAPPMGNIDLSSQRVQSTAVTSAAAPSPRIRLARWSRSLRMLRAH